MKFNKIFSLMLVATTLFYFTSCEKDKTPDAPELPPIESFAMDFSDFSNPDYSGSSKKSLIDPYRNFGYSYLTVAAWNTVATVVMAIPTATYAAALSDTPDYLGDNTWEWNFDGQVGTFNYSARLVTSRISNEEFKAEMFVSTSSSGFTGFEDFKWFEGVIRYDHTHAAWTLYESPTNPVALLSMEWNKDYETGLWDITYTNIKEGGEENGSYIKFEITANEQYNASYSISNSNGTVKIEWNRESKSGRVMSPVFFEDSLWHCWNELLQDAEC